MCRHPDPSKPVRTLVKAFGWECFSFVLTLLVSYLVTGDMSEATWLTIILFGLKVTFLVRVRAYVDAHSVGKVQ